MIARLEVEFEQGAAVVFFLGGLRQTVAGTPFVDLPVGSDMEETDVVEVGRYDFQSACCRVFLRYG